MFDLLIYGLAVAAVLAVVFWPLAVLDQWLYRRRIQRENLENYERWMRDVHH